MTHQGLLDYVSRQASVCQAGRTMYGTVFRLYPTLPGTVTPGHPHHVQRTHARTNTCMLLVLCGACAGVRRALMFGQTLAHENLVKIMGTWEDEKALYVVEEYASKGDVQQARSLDSVHGDLVEWILWTGKCSGQPRFKT